MRKDFKTKNDWKIWLKGLKKERNVNLAISKQLGRYTSGEWENELDFLEFIDEATGINCIILRGIFGQLNGYIQIPQNLISALGNKLEEYMDKINVHWGITFIGEMLHNDRKYIGFDCGHFGDYSPFMDCASNLLPPINATYKNIEYVKNECKKVAMQLHNMSKKENHD